LAREGKHIIMASDASDRNDLPQLPFPRDNVLDPAPEFAFLRAREPMSRVRTRAGDLAWAVTGYEASRQLFGDDRLGRSHPDPGNAPRISDSVLFGGPQGEYATEREDHKRMRRLLVPAFSARRMRQLSRHVQDRVDGMLDAMADLTPPADLHEALSFPLPILVICELLGVPPGDRDQFRAWSREYASLTDLETAQAAAAALFGYMGGLADRKRSEPGEDVISDLVGAAEETGLADGEIAEMAANIMFGGHETTVARIDYGTLLLLTHPEQRAALQRDPGLAEAAVEEIMRMAVPADHGFPRYAHADVQVGDTMIAAGEAVLLFPSIANRDGAAFPDPDRFDIGRRPDNAHVGFGHGAHYCVGATLARIELQAVFSTLFQRFPALELAAPVTDLRLNHDRLTSGLTCLPVTWS
jgi:cytochrome P450